MISSQREALKDATVRNPETSRKRFTGGCSAALGSGGQQAGRRLQELETAEVLAS